MKITTHLSEILYYIFFLLLFTTRALGLVEGNIFYSLTLVIGAVCFALSYLMILQTWFVRLCDAVLFLLASVSYLLSGEKGLLLFFAMMVGARATSLDRLFRCTLLTAGVAYGVMIFLGVFGLIPEYQTVSARVPLLGEVVRRSLGPLQLNVMMTPYLVFMMMALYLCRNKTRRQTVIVSTLLLGGLLYLFLYCFAKSALVAGILLLVGNYYYRFCCRYRRVSEIVVQGIYTGCTMVGIMGPILHDPSVPHRHLLSWYHRLYIGHYYWVNNTIPLFGQRLNDPDPESVIYPLIHQSQFYLLMQYGLVLFIVVNALYYMALHDMVKRRAGTEIAIILSYAVFGTVEPMLFNLSFRNISFLFVGVAYTCLVQSVGNKLHFGENERILLKDREWVLSFPDRGKRRLSMQTAMGNEGKCHYFLPMITGAILAGITAFLCASNVGRLSFTTTVFDRIRLVVSIFLWGSVGTGVVCRGVQPWE